MVRTRKQADVQRKMTPSRSRTEEPETSSTDASLAETNSRVRRKASKSRNKSKLSWIQRKSKSREYRTSQSHFLQSSSEDGRLLAIYSAGRLSDTLTYTDKTQVLQDASSLSKDANIEMEPSQIQELSSLQASKEQLVLSQDILQNSVSFTNINMPKGFQKYLDETAYASIANTASEKEMLEESNRSTPESNLSSSPLLSKTNHKRRHRKLQENQQLFQEVLGDDSEEHKSSDSPLSHKADVSENSALKSPVAAQPFRKKQKGGPFQAEFEEIFRRPSTRLSPRKSGSGSMKVSQSSISKPTSEVKTVGKRQKKIQNEDEFEDKLTQPSPKLSPRKSDSMMAYISQSSISKLPPEAQHFDKKQKKTQNQDTSGQSAPIPKKSSSKAREDSQHSISESVPAVMQFGNRQSRVQEFSHHSLNSQKDDSPMRKSNTNSREIEKNLGVTYELQISALVDRDSNSTVDENNSVSLDQRNSDHAIAAEMLKDGSERSLQEVRSKRGQQKHQESTDKATFGSGRFSPEVSVVESPKLYRLRIKLNKVLGDNCFCPVSAHCLQQSS